MRPMRNDIHPPSTEAQLELFPIIPDHPLPPLGGSTFRPAEEPDSLAAWLRTQSEDQLRTLLHTLSRNSGLRHA
jgi:hypothetical protein